MRITTFGITLSDGFHGTSEIEELIAMTSFLS